MLEMGSNVLSSGDYFIFVYNTIMRQDIAQDKVPETKGFFLTFYPTDRLGPRSGEHRELQRCQQPVLESSAFQHEIISDRKGMTGGLERVPVLARLRQRACLRQGLVLSRRKQINGVSVLVGQRSDDLSANP
ncbi:MAG: hypothetical protein WBP94_03410 [Rhodomicrobiaceae bacterium]